MSSSSSETRAGSVCPTEDIDCCDAVTKFSTNNTEEDESTYVDKDLDALLQDYWDEQDSEAQPADELCEKKCLEWLDKSTNQSKDISYCSEDAEEGKTSECDVNLPLPLEADMPIEKVAELLKDQLLLAKYCETYGNDDLTRVVPLLPLNQLIEDIKTNFPEALMSIIGIVFGETTNENDYYNQQIKKFLMEVLKVVTSVESTETPDGTEIVAAKNPKFKSFTESIQSNEKYFSNFEVILKPNTRLNRIIVEEVTAYVNQEIVKSKELQTPWININNRDINRIIHSTNEDKLLALTPEKLGKYGARLQKCVWDNIIRRCIVFLTDAGYDFLTLIQLKGSPAILESIDGCTTLTMSQESGTSSGEAPVLDDNNEQPEELVEDFSQPNSSQADSELEFLRGDSQSSYASFSWSPSVHGYSSRLPRLTPDSENLVSPTPSQQQLLAGYMNESVLSFRFGSQESGSGGLSHPKVRRLE